MTAPSHAIELKGKGRWYRKCADDCPLGEGYYLSVTNAQSVVAKPALVPAAVKATAGAAWEALPRMVATSRQSAGGPCAKARVADRCGACRFCITAAIKRHHREEWDSKADFGTLVHAHAHAHVLGRPMPHDEDVAPFLDQYLRFLDAWQVDIDTHVEAAETTVFDPKRLVAGTGDIWLWLPTGKNGKRELWLVDIKTSLTKPATAVYPDQVLQLAALRYMPKALLPDHTVVDVPRFAGAALLNLRADDHALIPLPANRDAYRAFCHAAELQKFFLTDVNTKAWTPLDVPPLTPPTRKAA